MSPSAASEWTGPSARTEREWSNLTDGSSDEMMKMETDKIMDDTNSNIQQVSGRPRTAKTWFGLIMNFPGTWTVCWFAVSPPWMLRHRSAGSTQFVFYRLASSTFCKMRHLLAPGRAGVDRISSVARLLGVDRKSTRNQSFAWAASARSTYLLGRAAEAESRLSRAWQFTLRSAVGCLQLHERMLGWHIMRNWINREKCTSRWHSGTAWFTLDLGHHTARPQLRALGRAGQTCNQRCTCETHLQQPRLCCRFGAELARPRQNTMERRWSVRVIPNSFPELSGLRDCRKVVGALRPVLESWDCTEVRVGARNHFIVLSPALSWDGDANASSIVSDSAGSHWAPVSLVVAAPHLWRSIGWLVACARAKAMA